jgi:8-oxo-dGTP pyrophosphatase MutT (NUDIX family)
MDTSKNSQMKLARQIAALPVRYSHDGLVLVLLVTSRETARWVIPKGWPWPDREEWKSAAEEAREEAGVLGKIYPASIGTYHYDKRRPIGDLAVHVTVFRLEVTDELATWPECHQRKRWWFSLMEAASAVEEPELQTLIRQLPNGAGTF